MRHWWDDTVTIETDKIGLVHSVSSTEEAARWLMEDWPVDKGVSYTFALKTCLAALQGRATVTEAQDAFVEAAKEAGNFIKVTSPPIGGQRAGKRRWFGRAES